MRYEVNAVMQSACTISHEAPPHTTLVLVAVAFGPCYPKGYAAPGLVRCQCNMRESLSKLKKISPHRKIVVTSKSPVGNISVVTLIRTDTTLDHSQKAEKVCHDASDSLHETPCSFGLCARAAKKTEQGRSVHYQRGLCHPRRSVRVGGVSF